jgi:hypothetical protein
VNQRGSPSTPGRRRQLPARVDQRRAAIVVVCCPPWMSFTIWDRHSFRREEEDTEDDSNGSRKRDNNKGIMTTTNDCSGRGRRNAKGRWSQNIVAIGRRRRWHRGMSRWLPPLPVVGRHHSREEGGGSEMLLSWGNVDNNDGANDNGWFQMNVPSLINKQGNASFRQTYAMRVPAF